MCVVCVCVFYVYEREIVYLVEEVQTLRFVYLEAPDAFLGQPLSRDDPFYLIPRSSYMWQAFTIL